MRRASAGRALRLLRPIATDAAAMLREQWRESLMTLSGVAWGAAAVVLLLSLGAGIHAFLHGSFRKTGDRYVQVRGDFTTSRSRGLRPGRPVTLHTDDLALVAAGAPSAQHVAGKIFAFAAVRTAQRTRSNVVSAASPSIREIQAHRIARGRFYDDEDERRARPLVVLGAALPEIFFGDRDPIGRDIQIDGRPFRVVGVLAPKGPQLTVNYALHDDTVFVPLRAGQAALGREDEIDWIYAATRPGGDEATLRREIRAALARHHGIADGDERALWTWSVSEVRQPALRAAAALRVLLGLIGTAVLAVAAGGVANRMVALVHGRRLELAVRRACGARRGDVLLQLVLETGAVIVTAGLAGVAAAAALVALLGLLPLPGIFPAPSEMSGVLLTAFCVLVASGIAAGVVPARLGAAQEPGAALRAP